MRPLSIFITSLLVLLRSIFFGQSKISDDSLNTLLKSHVHDTIKARGLISKGWESRAIDSDKAIELTKKGIELATKIKYKFGLGTALNNIGGIFYYKGNYVLAVEYYIKALAIHEEMKDSIRMAKAYNNLGLVYNDLLNYPLAIQYLEKANVINSIKRNTQGMASNLMNLGRVYAYQTKYDQSKEFFLRSLDLEKATKNIQGEAECYQSLGHIAIFKKDVNGAMKLYNRAIAIYDSIDDVENQAGCLSGISEAFTENENYKEAITYGLEALKFADKYGIDKEGTYHSLILAYEGSGDLKEALRYHRKMTTLRDSIYNIDLAKKVTEIETKYETEKMEQEIKLLEKENSLLNEKAEKRKVYIAFSLGGGLMLVILILIITDYRRKQQKAEQAKDKAVFELQALIAQMNPHFIFNALNSIQHFILEKGKQEAYDYLAKFSKLVRMVLNNSEDKMVSLQREFELIGLYVELEQLRFTNGFIYELNISENIHPENIELPTMLIQPYVENAIWHGLMNLNNERKGLVKIDISKVNEKLKISIEDNGVGRNRAKQFRKDEMHQSKGMKLTERRLQMINAMKDYENTSVTIFDLPNDSGTKVEILLPI